MTVPGDPVNLVYNFSESEIQLKVFPFILDENDCFELLAEERNGEIPAFGIEEAKEIVAILQHYIDILAGIKK